jgi:hypothetical protein
MTPRKRRAVLFPALALCAVALLVSCCVVGSFLWAVERCRIQHGLALGREIWTGMALESQEHEGFTIPAAWPYTVRDTWPMNYELHLRTGYRLPGENPEAVIGYFLARPSYPFWVRATGLAPVSRELLVLRENGSARMEPREKLAELTKDW